MALERWTPREDYTKQEERLLHRLRKTRKLFAFLRDHRRELFDDAFQAELESMYRSTGAGKNPTPPAFLAMVVILQSYLGISDAEAVDLTVMGSALADGPRSARGSRAGLRAGNFGRFSRAPHSH
jgi:hypothetical protein